MKSGSHLKKKAKKAWYQNGFTLLFATLVASLLLSLGVSILDITLQNFILSSTGRESQFAFYAADSGIECAIYWDKNFNGGSAFGTPPNDPNRQPTAPSSSISCSGKPIILNDTTQPPLGPNITTPPIYGDQGGSGSAEATSTYFFNIDMSNAPDKTTECFDVEVDKVGDLKPGSGTAGQDGYVPSSLTSHTYIKSRGYNTCDTSNLRRLERGLEIDY